MNSTEFLILLIKHSPSKPNFQAVADAEGLKKNATSMRYSRLMKASEAKTPSQSPDKGIKFLIQLIKHTPGKPDFQAVADALGMKKNAIAMRYSRLLKANQAPMLAQQGDEAVDGEDDATLPNAEKRSESERPGNKTKRTAAATDEENEVLSKRVKLMESD